ncbi:MAG: efflux RND transporter periplasmic adaptor subunit [Bacteroidota bacterium]
MSAFRLITLLIASGLLIQGCTGKAGKEAPIPASPERDTFTYKKYKVELISADNKLQFNGDVTYDQNNVVRVYPIVSGNAEDVNVELGTMVSAGQQLALIRSSDISNYGSAYRAAKANTELQKKDMEIAEALFKSQSVSELDVLRARKEYENAKTELSRQEAQLKMYGGNTASAEQPYYSVKSPINGYVVEKNLTKSMLIRPDNNAPLFTISDLRKVWVVADVYENDIAAIKTGQDVTISTLAYPDKEFTGKISNIASVLDRNSRVLKVRIELNNPDGILKPDMFALINIKIPESEKLLAVKPRSLIFDRDNYYVVIALPGNKFEIREVELVKSTGRFAYIRKGINVGDDVVSEGSLLIYNELKD